jgi:lipid-A-disaccharide synthase-like uncharacterized protein
MGWAMTEILGWLQTTGGQKVVWAVIFYFIAMLGAIVTYLFASSNGRESTVPRLKQLLPGKSDTFYYRTDFVFVILVGSAIGYIFFIPQDPIQALAAGCGWVGALNVLVDQKRAGGNQS